VFKKWNRKDSLANNRVFTSRYVYKIKQNAKTGAAYRFKARLIVRGFDCLIACKSATVMAAFKQDLLSRFQVSELMKEK
jgi:tRNA isopentenyl-2-thiomethyl-A-37 hydroxylase MiaE